MLEYCPPNPASQKSSAGALRHESARLQLLECLSETCALPGADEESCNWLRRKLRDAAFNLVVVGQFKRGKSSLINALLGEALLPTGVVPLTSAITTIRYGSEVRVRIRANSTEFVEISLGSLEDYVTERRNPRNVKRVEEVLIDYPCALLASGVRLVDTPGVDSIYGHNSVLTSSYVPQADAVVFVASVDQPFGQGELQFLRETAGYAGKIFCVLNKVDCLSAPELKESLAFCAAAIKESCGTPIPIFPVSARSILVPASRTDSVRVEEFRAFRSAIEDFIFKDKDETWCRSIARTIGRILAQISFNMELERSAAVAPVKELSAAIEFLQTKRLETLRDQAEQLAILRTHVLRLLTQEIEPELRLFGEAQNTTLQAHLPSWLQSHANLTTKKLYARLEEHLRAEVRTAFDTWIAKTEPRLSGAVESLCTRFWKETHSRIDELIWRCGALFQVSVAQVQAAPVWERESRFSYKFWSEPTSLQILNSVLLFALPRSLLAPIAMKRVRREATELVQLHTGRLRADVEERLRKSIDEFGQQVAANTTFVLGEIERALRRAATAQEEGQEALTTRMAQLRAFLDRVEAITAQLRELEK
jgi:GTPase SAR1 family protein